jgi:hypothetical protein
MMSQVRRPAAAPEDDGAGFTPATCRNHRREGITLAMRFNLEGRPCIS